MVRNFNEAGYAPARGSFEEQRVNEKYHSISDEGVRRSLIKLDQEFPQDLNQVKTMYGVRFVADLFDWNMYYAQRVYAYALDNQVIDLKSESNGRKTVYFFDPDGLRAYCALTSVFINQTTEYVNFPFKELVLKTRAALGAHALKDKLHDPNPRKRQTATPNSDESNKSPKKRVAGKNSAEVVAAETVETPVQHIRENVEIPTQPVLSEGFPVFDERQLEALREFDVDVFVLRLREQGLMGKIIKLEDIPDNVNALKVLRALHDVVLAKRKQDILVFAPIAEFLIYDELIRWIEEYRQIMSRFPGNRNLAVMYKILREGINKNPK